MITSMKVLVKPNNKQRSKLFQYTGTSRFAYNWVLDKQQENDKRRLQRKVSRKYQYDKEGERYKKTCNIIKSEQQLLTISKRLTNICQNYLHQITSEIVNRKPTFIVLEDLNVSGMMNNKHLAKAVQQQKFREFRRQVAYKTNGMASFF